MLLEKGKLSERVGRKATCRKPERDGRGVARKGILQSIDQSVHAFGSDAFFIVLPRDAAVKGSLESGGISPSYFSIESSRLTTSVQSLKEIKIKM